jgi:ParB-like chromosome segregation protein Spo0J
MHLAGASLEEFGLLKPPTFNVRSGRLLCGTTVVEALRQAGADECDVWCVDLDAPREAAASLMLNSHLNDWHWENVAAELRKVVAAGLPLTLTGMPESDTGPLLAAEWQPAAKVALDDVHADARQGGLFA